METIHLQGAEEVARASHRIQSAGDQMQRAASQMDEALGLHAQRMEELVSRLELAVAPLEVTMKPGGPYPMKLGEPGGPQCSRCELDGHGGYTCSQATCPSNKGGDRGQGS